MINQLLKITLITVAILGVVNLVSTNVLATGGQELESIYSQTTQLEKENQHLSNKIAAASSMASLEEKAAALGYSPISQTIAITTPAPVAYVAQ